MSDSIAEARFQTAAEFRAALLKPLAGAAVADGPKETRLASENLARPLEAPPMPQAPASQPPPLPAAAESYLKATRLASEASSQPAGLQAWPVRRDQPDRLPPLPSPKGIAQAAATAQAGRRPGRAVVAFLNHLDWRHYAGFGALLLAILSAPFLLVSKSDQQSATPPASAARPQSTPSSQATSAAAPTSEPVATPPANAIKNQSLPPATGSDTASASPPPRSSRGRRSTPAPDREARPPAKDKRDDSAKKDDKEPEKKDKDGKKGGIFHKLKKLNPFGRGDKKKD